MADAQGKTRFEDGEATRSLIFGINAFCALEDEFGITLDQIGSRLTPPLLDKDGNPVLDEAGKPMHKMPSMKDVRSIFRAGLIENWAGPGEEPTHREAGRLVTALGIEAATILVGDAFAAAFPEAAAAAGGDTTSGNLKIK